MIHVIKHVLLPCPGVSKRAKLPDSAPLTTKATLRHAPSHFRKNDFNRSMVCRHFGAVGWQTVFWLPNSPTSSNSPTSLRASSAATVSSHSTRTKYSAVSGRSEEHTSELQSLMRISYAVFCLKKKNKHT